MEFIVLCLRFIIELVFISTFLSKIFKPIPHLALIKEYKVLHTALIKPFFYIITICEILVSAALFCGFTLTGSSLAILLLLTYSVAISINLLKDNKLNCGCGGFLGDHKLSWILVLRNIIFISICIYLPLHGSDYILLTHSLISINKMLLGFSFSISLLLWANLLPYLGLIKKLLNKNLISYLKGGF